LKNSYAQFEEEGIILIAKSRIPKSVPKMRLAPDWTPKRDPTTGKIIVQGRLWDFIEKIAQSRREGKNRRDGATVSTRVLALADTLGRSLFATAAGELEREEAEMLGMKKTKRVETRARL
jgi:hypothetical protein